MPKPKLPAEFNEWIHKLDVADDVKEKMVESFEKSGAHKRYAGLHATATQATQAAEKYKKENAEWERFRDANPVINHWEQLGPALQMHTPNEVLRRLQTAQQEGGPAAPAVVQQATHAVRENQTRLAQLQRMRDANELTWEQFTEAAKPLAELIESQQSQLDQLAAGVSDFTKFRNDTLPQYAAGITATLQESNRTMATRLANHDREQIQRLRYAQQYPDRDVEEIFNHAQQNQASFMDAARDLYGEDDREAEHAQLTRPFAEKNKELEEKLAKYEQQRATAGETGEGTMMSRATRVFTRPGRRNQPPQQPRPVARSDGDIRDGLATVLGRFAP